MKLKNCKAALKRIKKIKLTRKNESKNILFFSKKFISKISVIHSSDLSTFLKLLPSL